MPTNRKIFLLIFVAVLVTTSCFKHRIDFLAIESVIENSGYLAPLLFMALYFICSLFFFPVFILTLASGALFGPYWGTLYTLISATLCASAALLITRFFAREWVKNLSGNILSRMINGVNNEGLFFVAFMRLVPIFPFAMTNYAFGLTNVRILPYSMTNFFCMMPASFAYSYIGFLGKSAATDNTGQPIRHFLVALTLFSSLVFITSLLKKHHEKKIKIPVAKAKNN